MAVTLTQREDCPDNRELVYRPVNYLIRALTDTERWFSKVEGESLAVLFRVNANHMYLYGTDFEAVVYHRPLVSLNNFPNRTAQVQINCLRSKLLAYEFKVVYEPGLMNPSDYSSHHPR